MKNLFLILPLLIILTSCHQSNSPNFFLTEEEEIVIPPKIEIEIDSLPDFKPPVYTPIQPDPNIILVKATAYCPCEKCCGKWADGFTTTGKNAYTPGVAADLNLVPIGTKLKIPGIGALTVDDTGRDMREAAKEGLHHIDVRFLTHQEALEFGIQWFYAEILPP